MIITKLNGGLGNQMFQYACGRALALRNNDMLKLDISGYADAAWNGKDTAREYRLSHFNIEENIADEKEIASARFPHGAVSKYIDIFRKKILRQYNVGFMPGILLKKTGDGKIGGGRSVYLDGFWQSEKNFADHADAIKKDFTLKRPMSPATQAIVVSMKAKNDGGPSVSIHIRRGECCRQCTKHLPRHSDARLLFAGACSYRPKYIKISASLFFPTTLNGQKKIWLFPTRRHMFREPEFPITKKSFS